MSIQWLDAERMQIWDEACCYFARKAGQAEDDEEREREKQNLKKKINE